MAITSQDKLDIYNGALRRLGERKLASLTENREPRRVLDDIWGSGDNLVKYALERGEWNFAIRTAEGTYSPSVTPDFGFVRAYPKPTDLRRLAGLSSDEYFRNALSNDEYVDEATYWFTNYDIIYIRYVSDDTDYGFNSAAWTEGFKDYLECLAAWEACERITNSTSKRDRLERDRNNALGTAKSVDAMGEGVKFRPTGGWVRSRGNITDRQRG